MTKIITRQLSYSTADDARDYFNGSSQVVQQPEQSVLQEGTYRVVDGVLCQVVGGLSPELAEVLLQDRLSVDYGGV